MNMNIGDELRNTMSVHHSDGTFIDQWVIFHNHVRNSWRVKLSSMNNALAAVIGDYDRSRSPIGRAFINQVASDGNIPY